jgi:hypothetical protein
MERGKPMSKAILMRSILAGVAVGAFALFVGGPASAAPVPSITAALKSAATSAVTEVRWRRWGWRRGYFIGSSYGWYRRGYCHIPGGYNRPNACW